VEPAREVKKEKLIFFPSTKQKNSNRDIKAG